MPRSPSRPILAAYFSLAAILGCGASVTVATTSANGTGGVSGTSGGGASGGTTGDAGSGGAGGMAGGSGASCHQCACVNYMSEGGCADLCHAPDNGVSYLYFCDGAPAKTQCAWCLMMNCPTADPNDPSTCM